MSTLIGKQINFKINKQMEVSTLEKAKKVLFTKKKRESYKLLKKTAEMKQLYEENYYIF